MSGHMGGQAGLPVTGGLAGRGSLPSCTPRAERWSEVVCAGLGLHLGGRREATANTESEPAMGQLTPNASICLTAKGP